MEQPWYRNKTVYFPMLSVVVVALLAAYLAELYDNKYYHFIFFYYSISSLFGYDAYETAYLNKRHEYPVLCSIAYVLFWVPKKLLFIFK